MTDLSLVNYDWLWNSIAELSMQEVQEYYKAVLTFHQAIGQNLPILVQLELTLPFSLTDDIYFTGTELLHLNKTNILMLSQLQNLSILECENLAQESVYRLLEVLGKRLQKVTLTNI